MNDTEIESALRTYASAYIRGYSEALDNNYPDVTRKIRELGFASSFFPLHGREPGRDVALAVLYTEFDFYLFFVDEQNALIKVFAVAGDPEGFTMEWTSNTPGSKRSERVKDYLGIADDPPLKEVNVPAPSFLSLDVTYLAEQGRRHGTNFGNQDGRKAEQALPALLESSQRAQQQAAFGQRYKEFQASTSSAQARGQAFEKLGAKCSLSTAGGPRRSGLQEKKMTSPLFTRACTS